MIQVIYTKLCVWITQLVILYSFSLCAYGADIAIVAPRTAYALDIAQTIEGRLLCDVDIVHTVDHIESTAVVVTLGYDALMRVKSEATYPVVAAFIAPSAVGPLVHEHASIIPIYYEPTPEDIVRFFDRNFPNSRVGYIYTNDEQHFISQIKSAASNAKVHFIFEPTTKKIDKAIRHIVKKNIDVLFIRENKTLYQNVSKRFVLESLLRKRIPAITTSSLLVKAGALASLEVAAEYVISEVAKQASAQAQCTLKDMGDTPYRINIQVNPDIQALYGTSIEHGMVP